MDMGRGGSRQDLSIVPNNSTTSEGILRGGYELCGRTRGHGAKDERETMIQKLKEEHTKRGMKQIHFEMEDSNNQILQIFKKQRTLANTERTYMFIQTMYLTFQVTAEDDPARKQVLQRMVETTFAVTATNGGEDHRAEIAREHRNEREVGIDSRITHDVRTDECNVEEIMK